MRRIAVSISKKRDQVEEVLRDKDTVSHRGYELEGFGSVDSLIGKISTNAFDRKWLESREEEELRITKVSHWFRRRLDIECLRSLKIFLLNILQLRSCINTREIWIREIRKESNRIGLMMVKSVLITKKKKMNR